MKTNQDFIAEVAKLPFFNGIRKLTDDEIQVSETMFHFGFTENAEDKFSSVMILRGVYKNHESPGYILIGSLGAVVKYDVDAKTINLTFAKDNDKDGFVFDVNDNIEEGEFFQQTLINDIRHVSFEHIQFLRDLTELTNQFELSVEKTA